MASVVTINNPEVVALIEKAAAQFAGGNKTAAVQLALQQLLQQHSCAAPLFGAHPGSVRVPHGVDLTAPILEDEPDASHLAWAAGPRAKAAGAKGHRAALRPPDWKR